MEMLNYIGVCLIGLLWHGAMKWDEFRRTSNDSANISLMSYLRKFKSQIAVSILASASAFLVALDMEWLNTGSALAAGYMGNSMAENFANRFLPQKQ